MGLLTGTFSSVHPRGEEKYSQTGAHQKKYEGSASGIPYIRQSFAHSPMAHEPANTEHPHRNQKRNKYKRGEVYAESSNRQQIKNDQWFHNQFNATRQLLSPYLKKIADKISEELQNKENKTEGMGDKEIALVCACMDFYRRNVVVESGVVNDSAVLKFKVGAEHVHQKHDEDDDAGNHRVNLSKEIGALSNWTKISLFLSSGMGAASISDDKKRLA